MAKKRICYQRYTKMDVQAIMRAYLNGEIKSVFRGNKNLHKRNFYDLK